MQDALFDAVDVVPSKARNAYYFSTPRRLPGAEAYVTSNPYTTATRGRPIRRTARWAITSRTISFGGQPLFPPGIDLEKPSRRPVPVVRSVRLRHAQPLHRRSGPEPRRQPRVREPERHHLVSRQLAALQDGRLIGGARRQRRRRGAERSGLAAGAAGFEPPAELRVDNSVIRTGAGDDVRLPYLKFPRNATQK